MGLNLRWVGDDERERVAEARMLSFAPGRAALPAYVERIQNETHIKAGDFLLAEKNGEPVGTATSIPMTMWVRGGPVRCQGVAHVGTIKTQRRKTGAGPGIATLVMNEMLRAARERGFVVSALMPFRGSFYEKFGYGFVERRIEWTLPMAVLPKGEFDDIGFYRPEDLDELVRFKQRVTEHTHGDIERPRHLWERYIRQADEGFVVVDRSAGGAIRSVAFFQDKHDQAGPDSVRVVETIYEDVPALRRQLHFIGSLRDQYANAKLMLPADLRLNLLLTETQMTHRANRNHATAEARPFNRMQVRVLDHVKLLGAINLQSTARGSVVVGVRDVEGGVTKLAIEISEGRVSAKATAAAVQVEMADRVWAPVVFGDLLASEAHRLGLLTTTDERALGVLDAFGEGPAPYCHEYF
ncbi:MAG TPA: GNAT family N-acetyltransferase [Tepidisphaeraceae bacterium]|nr:GNAT family N-acetyltransferase [Tepidisphaeraceae bacterium]